MDSVLIIEDDLSTSELIAFVLSTNGYACQTAYDARSGLKAFKQTFPDAIVLELMLPDMSGLEVCTQIRNAGFEKDPYILFLTAKGSTTDRIVGLSTGADDYLVKPFDPDELVVHIRTLLRRKNRLRKPDISFSTAHFDFNLSQRRIYLRKIPQCQIEITPELTPAEYLLFVYLAKNLGRVLSREQILAEVWGDRVVERTVDSLVFRLRKRLKSIFPEGKR